MEEKSYKTSNKIYETELLAPAKDINCAMTAIECGADAVYIGASSFGARKKAGNSIEDIKKIVEYAHLFNVKIYVTVNTVIFDDELKDVEKLINELYSIGVDALIIQDLGIFKLNLPPIPLHASTQCHNLDIEKIKFLQSLNISRIVLPRELSLSEIQKVKEETDAELEFFVHGALCVSYSGQCYLSQAIGGRSANRGECAQPCRNKYSLVDEKGNYIIKDKYLLSLKDFCLIDNLEDLIKSGVKSFKIEGRLKDEDYIKTTVLAYRKRLDKIPFSKKSSFGKIITNFNPDLSKVFNRGFTKYNIEKSDINSIDTPKNRGEFIGTVKSVFKNGFEISNSQKLNQNDGICAFINKELTGSTVTKIEGNKIFLLNPLSLKNGDKIFRNLDFEYQKLSKNTPVQRKLFVNINVIFSKSKIIFSMKENNNSAVIFIENSFEKAKNEQKAKETIIKQLSKLGDTVFAAQNIEITGEIPFIPVSNLNEIRRNLAEKLRENILENYEFSERDLIFEPKEFPKNIENDYKLNITNKNAKEIYKQAGVKNPSEGFETSPHIKNAVLMQTKNCLRKLCGICLKNNSDKRKLFLQDSFNNRYPLNFDCKNCVMEILDYE